MNKKPRRYNWPHIRLIIFALIILLIGVSLGYYLTFVIHRSYYGVRFNFIAFAADKLTYFKNTTGVYDNTIKQGKGRYFSNDTGSFLQLPNGTIMDSAATGLCNIMTQVYRDKFPTQCGKFAAPFIR